MLCMGWTESLADDVQTYEVMYVDQENGAFANGGTSWSDAKNNLQTAIDELYDKIKTEGATTVGYVFVAKGTYTPTRRSTDESDGSMFNTSFRIPERIYVFGGFNGDETADAPQNLPGKRIMARINDAGEEVRAATYDEEQAFIAQDNIDGAVRRWNFYYKTILSGNHSVVTTSFTYEPSRGLYHTTFPLNSYHVVWFGTNGEIGDTGHYQSLENEAAIDGCTIQEGNASSRVTSGHDHTGYGGGVYMVGNSLLRNCVVERCAATLRGGGVYMDGGGTMERCYVHTCQASGIGVVQGYGGAVCIDYLGSVQHSYILQSAARIGGGLAICHVPGEYPFALVGDGKQASMYEPHAIATLIANCTGNAEGGGVYLDEGGTLNHCTVVKNKCTGPDVVYYGRRHGRTGGIYVRNCGTIYNSVAWGNESPVNNDVQFGCSKTSDDASYKIEIYHSAFSKHDITDWSNTRKTNVVSLTNANYPTANDYVGNFPMFYHPTDTIVVAGGENISAGIMHYNGVVRPDEVEPGQPYQKVYNWHPIAASALRMKAVQVTSAISGIADEISHAHTTIDVVGRQFEAISSCGALAHSYRTIQAVLLPSLETTDAAGTLIPTIFVDPQRSVYGTDNSDDVTGYEDDQAVGQSWTHPAGNLPDAIKFFKDRIGQKVALQSDGSVEYQYTFREGELFNADGTAATSLTHDYVQVFVKEGTFNTAGTGSYIGSQARTASIRPASNMRLYGGFSSSFTGQTIDGRNQRTTPTRVNANVLGDTYENNAAHVFALVNVKNVVVDGFRLSSGNANLSADSYAPEGTEITFGGGVLVNNSTIAQDARINMTGNILRNSVISNCSAPRGAAIYVNGQYPRADGNRCAAELTVVNTIMRNSTAGDMRHPDGTPWADRYTVEKTEGGVVTANGNAHIWLRNCDIVNNCGYALKSTADNSDGTYGKLEIYNSIIFSNGLKIASDRRTLSDDGSVSCLWTENITGNYLYTDYDADGGQRPSHLGSDVKYFNLLTRNKNGVNGDCETNPKAVTTATNYDDIKMLRYPYFINPSRNVGHSTGADQPMYGGVVNYEPLNMNPLVNGANDDMESGSDIISTGSSLAQRSKTISYDSGLRSRIYGGAPDAGAIENTRLPKVGAVIYVTPDGAGKRDGSSWSNAIAGNTIYALNGAAAAGTDALDEANGTTRIINATGDGTATTGAANGVLTTDWRYCGGFAESYMSGKTLGGKTQTTVTKTWTTESNVYTGGSEDRTDILNESYAESSAVKETQAGSEDGSFTKGWQADTRFPYGELSGNSRSFWRSKGNSSPVPEWWSKATFNKNDVVSNPNDASETVTGLLPEGTLPNDQGQTFLEYITAADTPESDRVIIKNERTENYVGGLQYAVELATAYNKQGSTEPRIEGVEAKQVWVSNGKYTDYKGFIMRDNTVVMGSFPAVKDGVVLTPGETERQALMSDPDEVVDIPKALMAADLNPVDYETILQISDVNPRLSNTALNTAAVNSWDNDYKIVEATNTTKFEYKAHNITHYYKWVDEGENNVSSLYVQNSKDNKTDRLNQNGYKVSIFGTASGNIDNWHLWIPEQNSAYRIGAYTDSGGTIYDADDKKVDSHSGNRFHLRDGSLTGLELWQTMKNVEAGKYRLTIDVGAFYYDDYTNKNNNTGNVNTGVTIYVIDADGNVVYQEDNVFYYTGRNNMKRLTVTFEQPESEKGELTVKIVVGHGRDKDNNEIDDDSSVAFANNPYRRELNVGYVYLYKVVESQYVVDESKGGGSGTVEQTVNKADVTKEADIVETKTSYIASKERQILRKRVLQMPDVTNPVWTLGGYLGDPSTNETAQMGNNDFLSHSERMAAGSGREANDVDSRRAPDPNYQTYDNVVWDGFTIRHGFLYNLCLVHGGGAGVSMYEGAHLRNCVIIDNFSGGKRNKGGGVFVDGATATIEGCFIISNTSTHGAKNEQGQIFGGGLFLYEGTCFNTLIANNYAHGFGGGLGLCVGKFYNNTLSYNTSGNRNGGLRIADKARSSILMANSIIYGNDGAAISMTSTATFSPFIHCYVQSVDSIPNGGILNAIRSASERKGGVGVGNTFLNGPDYGGMLSKENTPFEKDIDAAGNYTGEAKTYNDFRLRIMESNAGCINTGADEGMLGISLPNNDVAFAERVQDCKIDIGAYEYDGSKDIEPQLIRRIDEDGRLVREAIFYVNQNGTGTATAASPEEAACVSKLQLVFDAAGRWKYAARHLGATGSILTNFNADENLMLSKELNQGIGIKAADNVTMPDGTVLGDITMDSLKTFTVIVKMAGDYTQTKTNFSYSPTHVPLKLTDVEENLLEYSLTIPHGVQVKGGYSAEEVKVTTNGTTVTVPAYDESSRDVIGYPTRLSGKVSNASTGATGQVFHVVTFTNHLFRPGMERSLYKNSDDETLLYTLKELSDADVVGADSARHRAVLDGLFIIDGDANGTDEDFRRGGAAVVPSYAHVKNCIIKDNTATRYGGGLYLQPGALVSGSIIKDNSAQYGGGLYVEAPSVSAKNSEQTDDEYQKAQRVAVEQQYTRIYTSTVVFNDATVSGGGIYFDSSYPNLLCNSSAFWQNTANDFANVAGNFNAQTNSKNENIYAFTCCGVESRRMPGVNNLLLPVIDGEGVRWDHHDRFEDGLLSGTILYVPITLSSILARSGMTYDAYETVMKEYPTMELRDVAGLARMEQNKEQQISWDNTGGDVVISPVSFKKVKKKNDFIEMGARVLNKSFEVQVDASNVMRRIFVAKTESLPEPAALELLQENESTEPVALMYKQMGSSFANPFHRLGDAFEYIKAVRSYEGLKDTYKDVRFEVFVGEGEFRPFHDAYGQQGSARTNTFVIPEAVTVVGGVDNTIKTAGDNHTYCQAGYGESDDADVQVPITINGVDRGVMTLYAAKTQTIRDKREVYDYNGNNVYEPWELKKLSKVMGDAVDANSAGSTNIYHLITIMSDKERVGELPTRKDNGGNVLESLSSETTQAKLLANMEQESLESRDARTIILDGLQITGGYANNINPEHSLEARDKPETSDDLQQLTDESDEAFMERCKRRATQLTYFRGGGILVDGNWDDHFLRKSSLPEVLGVPKRDIPLIVTHCEFQNNMAGNGGAIYSNGTLFIMSSHFTQNHSSGPINEDDRNFIPWTAGGAIATNYECNVWNSLFDNNEAERGLPIYERVQNEAGITNTEARQGSGGVISSSETSTVRMSNCDLVRNRAQQFPAIYNFLDNSLRQYGSYDQSGEPTYPYGRGRHYALNTIFWGNDVPDDVKDLAPALAVPLIGGKTDHRRRDMVANFGPDMDQEMLYFCAYEQGKARYASLPVDLADQESAKMSDIVDASGNKVTITALKDGSFSRERAFGTYKRNSDGNLVTGTDSIYNHNQLLNSNNLASDGPSFVQPSIEAGIAGYMQNADWLVDRLNVLIDNGWSYLEQEVTQPSLTSTKLITNFFSKDGTSIYANGNMTELDEADGTADGKLKTKSGGVETTFNLIDSPATNSSTDGLKGNGFYNQHSGGESRATYNRFKSLGFSDLLPMADESYMTYTRENEIGTYDMRRISTYPKMGQQHVFIDIGVYEYQYVQLNPLGNETDVIWVGPSERGTHDGSTSANATTNLQDAIEILLLSRNGHDKVVKLIGGKNPDGTEYEYSPLRVSSKNKLAFFVKMPRSDDGVSLTGGIASSEDARGIKSLTIRGGYSDNTNDHTTDGEAVRDAELFPSRIVMKPISSNTTLDQMDHLFIVEDAQQKETYGTMVSNRVTKFGNAPVPIIVEGLKFINTYASNVDEKGGAALYYETQNFWESESSLGGGVLKPLESGEAKFTVKNCEFMLNGASADVSAVAIEEGGGEALVVNSLFHSNTGAPIVGKNTKVVNSTFALNGGHLTLSDAVETYAGGTTSGTSLYSELQNSIIWKDNGGTGTQFEGVTVDAKKRVTHNAVSGETFTDEEDDYRNISLSDVNTDIFRGPNFVDPKETFAAGMTDKEKQAQMLTRDFHVNPSARIINGADIATYKKLVPYFPSYPKYENNYPDTEKQGTYSEVRTVKDIHDNDLSYYFHSAQRGDMQTLADEYLKGIATYEKNGLTLNDYTEYELSGKARWQADGMERGAYESTARFERVLYVYGEGYNDKNGVDWENAYPISNIQSAIDMASIYSATHEDAHGEHERAYVFVKGDNATAGGVTLRDGVSVYGSVPRADFSEEAKKDIDDNNDEIMDRYSDASLMAYINKVKAVRGGVATRGATVSIVPSVKSDVNDTEFKTGFLLDGFKITASGEQIEPVVQLTQKGSIVAGSIVSDITMAVGQPVVKIDKGLLYNTLLYGNTADAVVNVGANGRVLNCTAVAAHDGELAIKGTTAGSVVNTVTYNEATSTLAREGEGVFTQCNTKTSAPFAPYLREGNAYTQTLPTYLTSHAPYYYQLHEASAAINGGNNNAKSLATLSDWTEWFDFDHDRDLLGNPRKLGGTVDLGAFETLKVADEKAVEATNVTNTANEVNGSGDVTKYAYVDNYGGHLYPHDGSVVYIGKEANLVLHADDKMTVRPGYLLVKEGGSLYGQGNTVQAGYVAVEKQPAVGEQYRLVSLPYAHDLQNAISVSYDEESDALTEVNVKDDFASPYIYNGSTTDGRAGWRYNFQEENSTCWQSAATSREALVGWLMERNDAATADTKPVRLTGWGASQGVYAYEENGDAKTVTLTQYNQTEINGSTGQPEFTKLEDMGWNLRGLPFLISQYETSPVDDHTYQMQVPHVIYTMGGDGTYEKMADKIYSAQSWDSGATLTLGEGFFTQTAIIGDAETLTFKVPLYGAAVTAPSKPYVGLRSVDGEADVVEIRPVVGADKDMEFDMGRDGVKWQSFSEGPTLYVQNAAETALSLVAEAPTETEIPLGYGVAKEGMYTIELPDKDAYSDVNGVWLTDHETGAVTNLQQQAYQMKVSSAGQNSRRLTIRFGGGRPEKATEGSAPYRIYAVGTTLHIEGLKDGDHVRIYTTGGAIVDSHEADASHYKKNVQPTAIYIVRINNYTKSIRVK